ncbi:hypothetical protein A3711_10220 [Erythrobacter sp. HI00D59]|nr:hypothetical protein A3711_10220 [Erythrobacter sp. HI00D59]
MLPLEQEDYFRAQYLRFLFQQKISKSRATGKDGVRMEKFIERLPSESEIIERKFQNGTYKFTRYKERLLLRGADREPRQISIPTVRDRLTLRSLCQLLHDKEPASKGYSPHAVVDQVIKCVSQGPSSHQFVRIDVRNFYPSIVHTKLESALKRSKIDPLVRTLAMSAVKTATGKAEENVRGVPQGLSISGALSGVYLKSLDEKFRSRFDNYFRYVDDILCVVDKREARRVIESITKSLNSLGLTIHEEGIAGKTEIRGLDKGIDFLGYHITSQTVSVRESSFKRMFSNLLKVITDYRYRRSVDRTLFRLNLKITGCIVDGKRRGWLMFFSRTEDLSQLKFLDVFVSKQLHRVGFPSLKQNNVARFIKAYHEIRYNIAESAYVPNFDKYDLFQKKKLVSDYRGLKDVEIESWDASKIEDEFSKIVSSEVHDLEEDIGAFS